MKQQQAGGVAAQSLALQSQDTDADRRLTKAFEAEEREGEVLAIRGRTYSLLSIAALLAFVVPFPEVLFYHGLLAVFVLFGLINYWLTKRGLMRRWLEYLFVAVDFALLSVTLLLPNPFAEVITVPQMQLRTGNFIYFFVLLCGLAFSYRPRMMLWGGVIGAISWSVGALLIVMLPETTISVDESASRGEILAAILAPTYVDLGFRVQEVVVLLIVAGLLATIVERSRKLVMRQVSSERERGNLARYFPPTMVDRLASMDAPLSQTREQNVAVLFADIVGFTRWSEDRSPTEVIAFLREVHSRLESAVFEHDGTLDKFIGDGVMATFGTPETGPDDAANALGALRTILESFDAWNASRANEGEDPVGISVGIHYGPVVVGDIGTERRLEFAVLGDTVNVASRLEQLTRSVGCRAVVSDNLVAAVRKAVNEDVAAKVLDGLQGGASEDIRGRHEPVRIWTL